MKITYKCVLNYNVVEKYPNLETKAFRTRRKIDNCQQEVENVGRKAVFEINIQGQGEVKETAQRANKESEVVFGRSFRDLSPSLINLPAVEVLWKLQCQLDSQHSAQNNPN